MSEISTAMGLRFLSQLEEEARLKYILDGDS